MEKQQSSEWEGKEQSNFKFLSLRTYSTTEWLMNNQKKYRQVFDRQKVSFIYIELAIENLKYLSSNWDADIILVCFKKRGPREVELCKLNPQVKVEPGERKIYIREGWGNADKSIWKTGVYFWRVYINGKDIGKKYFFIEDSGDDKDNRSSFVDVDTVKLYEGPIDDVVPEGRTYLRQFDGSKTRHIYAEIQLDNLHDSKIWHCELIVRIFTASRELKGEVVRLKKVKDFDDTIEFIVGWGNTEPGTWRKGLYTLELVFMDEALAVIPFEVGERHIEGYNRIYTAEGEIPIAFEPEEDDLDSFTDVLAQLDSMVGLDAIKTQVKEHAQYLQFLKLRAERGFSDTQNISLHSAFLGKPGTGKTTIAKMMGKIYKKMGFLSRGHIVEVDRAELVGEYIGQTAPKVKEAIEKANGGILFIDEAYSLARENDDSKDFGREVIEILVKAMTQPNVDFAVIVAGYPKEMEYFLSSNPGFRSRFRQLYYFPDYLPQELNLIADQLADRREVSFTDEAASYLHQMVIRAYRNRDYTFGNARFVDQLIEKSKVQLGLRVMNSDTPTDLENEFLSTIILNDVEKINVKPSQSIAAIPVDEELLSESLKELDELVGLEQVKSDIHDMVRVVRHYEKAGMPVLSRFHLHTVLVGNPGTGKNTVSRILAKIYRGLGILERGHLVETDRQGLIAGYVGQSAIKTNEKIEKANGGVLFIDEAYGLSDAGASGNNFGHEVVETLLKRMEDLRGQFFVFVAGYPKKMKQFLEMNPGLRSRFDRTLIFKDYKPDELLEIAFRLLDKEHVTMESSTTDKLKAYFSKAYQQRGAFSGNARMVNSLMREALNFRAVRLSKSEQDEQDDSLKWSDISYGIQTLDAFDFGETKIGFTGRE